MGPDPSSPVKNAPTQGLIVRIILGSGQEHADTSHLLGLLSMHKERPCSSSNDERDELAPPHIPLLGKESAKID